jgi:formylglycine-generating enzyme required for sulfatase activity
MVVIPGPVEFLMGSPPTEPGRDGNEAQHPKRISRTFAIAAKSVTVSEYRRYDAGHGKGAIDSRARTPDSPMILTTWYHAAGYCNWLSKQEGIPEDQWCYEMKGGVVKLKEKYLSLSGYRLPTEAEMEYATRAEARTARYFGETEELLPKYAWYVKNAQDRTWPVGSLKPNDLGFFDMLGNVYTWCQESYKSDPVGVGAEAVEDREDQLVVRSTDNRMLRGGSFFNLPSVVRSASRTYDVPTIPSFFIGFRVAKTIQP